MFLSSQLILFGLSTWLKPLWIVAAGLVVAIALLMLLALLLELAKPTRKIAAIAWTTAKEAVSQPLFYLLLAIGVGLLMLSLLLPYYTFGDDVKVVEENGLTLVMVLSMILGLWTASVSVSEELEGRTALTVLCKPISRRDFILGKFLGIVGSVALLFIILGAFFLGSVSYKVMYDARETAMPDPTWIQCQTEMLRIAPGLVLALMEAVVMASISVAVATRLTMLPNLVICVSIYVLGHLVPMLAKSAVGQMPMVPFVADLLSAILPVLDHFNIYGAISMGGWVPPAYLGWAMLYCTIYATIAMLAALVLFEDRDLA